MALYLARLPGWLVLKETKAVQSKAAAILFKDIQPSGLSRTRAQVLLASGELQFVRESGGLSVVATSEFDAEEHDIKLARSTFAAISMAWKPPNMPTLSKDFLDNFSLENCLFNVKTTNGKFFSSKKVRTVEWKVENSLPRLPIRLTKAQEQALSALAQSDASNKAQGKQTQTQTHDTSKHIFQSTREAMNVLTASTKGSNPSAHVREQGILHRLDNETQGWIPVASTQKVYDAYVFLRSHGKIVSFYSITSSPYRDNLMFEALNRLKDDKMNYVSGTAAYGLVYEAVLQGPYLHLALKSGFVQKKELSLVVPGKQERVDEAIFWSDDLTRGHYDDDEEQPPLKTSFFRFHLKDIERFAHTSRKKHRQGSIRFEAYLQQGARHQLRAHLRAAGLPIGGDMRYGKPDEKFYDRLMLECNAYAICVDENGETKDDSLVTLFGDANWTSPLQKRV